MLCFYIGGTIVIYFLFALIFQNGLTALDVVDAGEHEEEPLWCKALGLTAHDEQIYRLLRKYMKKQATVETQEDSPAYSGELVDLSQEPHQLAGTSQEPSSLEQTATFLRSRATQVCTHNTLWDLYET